MIQLGVAEFTKTSLALSLFRKNSKKNVGNTAIGTRCVFMSSSIPLNYQFLLKKTSIKEPDKLY